jgi:periplasmic divalent cation tolerance protein
VSHVVVLCSVGSAADAERLASGVVEAGLAACVSVLSGVTSFYRWKGELQRDEERLLVIKTRADRVEALRAALVAGHPYEVPEVLALPVLAGHRPYLDWSDASLS